ncbi:glycerol-3-phosphate 1-O-acyltransferase PlsY [Fangia hongkongensis]|uniref:glycerol-3-phosphate 1-O-acyltransferase PlsY n=1 Tax=Fangia hongkongensis TaxID=270495 RepID=UPI00036AAFC9|nr:glycerol-3-phosphate 1-O-acyltransferase PlsY [Fangia hongkongensis]MBK2125101.1 glycerol-3-phosphate 1-O-acyltransferase PlsY [Fangia hongkongensis]
MFILMLIIGYLFGSINSAILTCHALRLPSPRSIGSGNPGATNVLRLGGKKAAAITLIGDALKGFIPVIIAHGIGLTHLEIGYVALLAVLGHIFPIFFGFKGGKGVATLIGVMLGFYWLVGVIFLIIWLLCALITKYSSLSALIATLLSALSTILLFNITTAIPFLIMAIIVILRHYQNIQRLIQGTESKIGQKSKK